MKKRWLWLTLLLWLTPIELGPPGGFMYMKVTRDAGRSSDDSTTTVRLTGVELTARPLKAGENEYSITSFVPGEFCVTFTAGSIVEGCGR